MMKKLFALLLAAMLLLNLTACGGGGNTDQPGKTDEPKVELTTFEMTCEPDFVEEPAKATIGYPGNFTMEQKDWSVVLTDEAKDVSVEVFFSADFSCYDANEEYAKEEYFFYESATYGKYKGYVTRMDEESADVEAQVYLDLVEDTDDVYLTFRISSASGNLDADPVAMYRLPEVQQVLNSVVYTAPAK